MSLPPTPETGNPRRSLSQRPSVATGAIIPAPQQLALAPEEMMLATVRALDPWSAGGVMELATMDVAGGGKMMVGYFDGPEVLVKAATQVDARDGNLYVTVNPVRRDLLARGHNRLVPWAKARTANTDINSIRFLFIDCDPVRPSGIAATDPEKAAAWRLTMTVVQALKELQPDTAPIIGDSGNGFYILLPLGGLPATPETEGRITELYKLLDAEARRRLPQEESAAPSATIDMTTRNPARLMRLLGTMNRKGDNVPAIGRVWRRSGLLSLALP